MKLDYNRAITGLEHLLRQVAVTEVPRLPPMLESRLSTAHSTDRGSRPRNQAGKGKKWRA